MAAQPLPAAEPPPTPFGRLAAARPLALGAAALATAGLALLLTATWRLVTAAATNPARLLVPSGHGHMPAWMGGPLIGRGTTLGAPGLIVLLVEMALLYLVVLAFSRALPLWIAATGVVILTALFALSPPLFSTDIFNYVAYGRMGALYGVNPYAHGVAAIPFDPSFALSGRVWRHTTSAYGPLFTLISYAFAPLGVSGAMWAFKALAGASALGCAALIWACAKRLDIRPVPAVLLFALNPLVLVYAVGGGHNDLLMALPLLAGALLILRGKPALGGAALMAAVGIKLTAGLVLPFVLVASGARVRGLAGAAAAALCMAALGLLVFGPHVTSTVNVLQREAHVLKPVSGVPGYLGHVIGQGGLTPKRRTLFELVFCTGAVALLALAWRRRDWLAGAGGALLLLFATSGSVFAWYVVAPLALAPLARRRWVLLFAIVLTGVVVAMQIRIYDAHQERATRRAGVEPAHLHVGMLPRSYAVKAAGAPKLTATPRGTTSTGQPDVSIA